MASPIKLLQNEGARPQISNLEGAQLWSLEVTCLF